MSIKNLRKEEEKNNGVKTKKHNKRQQAKTKSDLRPNGVANLKTDGAGGKSTYKMGNNSSGNHQAPMNTNKTTGKMTSGGDFIGFKREYENFDKAKLNSKEVAKKASVAGDESLATGGTKTKNVVRGRTNNALKAHQVKKGKTMSKGESLLDDAKDILGKGTDKANNTLGKAGSSSKKFADKAYSGLKKGVPKAAKKLGKVGKLAAVVGAGAAAASAANNAMEERSKRLQMQQAEEARRLREALGR